MTDRFILLTGCSGGGKSTLLSALGKRGFATVQEPGRRIVAQELAEDGSALPWVDARAFARRAIEMAKSDLRAAQHIDGIVFFDRGLIDAAVAMAHSGGQTIEETLHEAPRYSIQVFVVPPWRELFAKDHERRHDFRAATRENTRIEKALYALGYTKTDLPKVSVEERVDFMLRERGAF